MTSLHLEASKAGSTPGSKSMLKHLVKPHFLITSGQQAFPAEPGACVPVYCQVFKATVKTLTLTIDSLAWAMSEMTPSVMMRSTKYWEPSFTEAAYLQTQTHKTILAIISVLTHSFVYYNDLQHHVRGSLKQFRLVAK